MILYIQEYLNIFSIPSLPPSLGFPFHTPYPSLLRPITWYAKTWSLVPVVSPCPFYLFPLVFRLPQNRRRQRVRVGGSLSVRIVGGSSPPFKPVAAGATTSPATVTRQIKTLTATLNRPRSRALCWKARKKLTRTVAGQ